MLFFPRLQRFDDCLGDPVKMGGGAGEMIAMSGDENQEPAVAGNHRESVHSHTVQG